MIRQTARPTPPHQVPVFAGLKGLIEINRELAKGSAAPFSRCAAERMWKIIVPAVLLGVFACRTGYFSLGVRRSSVAAASTPIDARSVWRAVARCAMAASRAVLQSRLRSAAI